MQQKTTETNKTRLIKGGRTFFGLVWAVSVFWTFSSVMTLGGTTEKVVAGVMIITSLIELFKTFKDIWDKS